MDQAPAARRSPEVAAIKMDDGNSAAIRRAHIAVETNIRGIGSLSILSGLFLCELFLTSTSGYRPRTPSIEWDPLLLKSLGVAGLLVGVLLRRLHPLGRVLSPFILGTAVVLGLVMDALNAAVLAGLASVPSLILWSPRASVVFSDRYRRVVVPETPQVKPPRFPMKALVAGAALLLIAQVAVSLFSPIP